MLKGKISRLKNYFTLFVKLLVGISLIIPPREHCNWQSNVKIGFFVEKIRLGFVCIHGPRGATTQGPPLSTAQTPNGTMFMPGIISKIVPTGVLQQKLQDGVALKGVGQLPKEHIHNVPVLTTNPIRV